MVGAHPLFTKANATRRGARPSPATQWTPILSYLFYSEEHFFFKTLFSSFVSSIVIGALISLSLLSSVTVDVLFAVLSKKSSTILNHLF